MIQISKLAGLKRAATKAGWGQFIRSEADERAVLNGCWFDVRAANRPVAFMERFLVHSKGRWGGKPLVLDDWQRDDLVFPVFGWRSQRGGRRYRKTYWEVPKKNGKSTISSALGIYLLCGDGENGAEVYAAATDRIQAGIVHGEAQKMVLASPALRGLLQVRASTREILYPGRSGNFRALASIANKQEGLNASAIIADELHAWQGRKLYDAIQWAFAARDNPLFIQITTAGDDLESVCYEQHEYARGVIDGTIHDDAFHPYIRTVKNPRCSLSDENEWFRANPGLGKSIGLEQFSADASAAAKRPTTEAAFRRYRLNIWTSAGTKWIDSDQWQACADESFDLSELEGRNCFGALDLSRTRDSSSLALVFPMEDGTVRLATWFWLPRDEAKRQSDLVSWLPWANQGAVRLIDGPVQQYSLIRDDIRQLSERFTILELAFDPWGAADHLTQQLEDEDGIPRVQFGQRLQNFAPAVEEMERRILDGTLKHSGNPVMDWQIQNCVMKVIDNTRKKPIRPKPDDHKKIDGPICSLMALARLMVDESGGDVDVREL